MTKERKHKPEVLKPDKEYLKTIEWKKYNLLSPETTRDIYEERLQNIPSFQRGIRRKKSEGLQEKEKKSLIEAFLEYKKQENPLIGITLEKVVPIENNPTKQAQSQRLQSIKTRLGKENLDLIPPIQNDQRILKLVEDQVEHAIFHGIELKDISAKLGLSKSKLKHALNRLRNQEEKNLPKNLKKYIKEQKKEKVKELRQRGVVSLGTISEEINRTVSSVTIYIQEENLQVKNVRRSSEKINETNKIIEKLLNEGMKPIQIRKELLERGIDMKSGTLDHYINEIRKKQKEKPQE